MLSEKEFPFLIGRIRTVIFITQYIGQHIQFPFLIGRIRTYEKEEEVKSDEVSIPHR